MDGSVLDWSSIRISYHVFRIMESCYLIDPCLLDVFKIDHQLFNMLKGDTTEYDRMPSEIQELVQSGSLWSWNQGELREAAPMTDRLDPFYIVDIVRGNASMDHHLDPSSLEHQITRSSAEIVVFVTNGDRSKTETELSQWCAAAGKKLLVQRVRTQSSVKLPMPLGRAFERLGEMMQEIDDWCSMITSPLGMYVVRMRYGLGRLQRCSLPEDMISTNAGGGKCPWLSEHRLPGGRPSGEETYRTNCLSCWARYVCGGPCPRRQFSTQRCDLTKKLIEWSADYAYKNPERIDRIMLDVLSSPEFAVAMKHCGI